MFAALGEGLGCGGFGVAGLNLDVDVDQRQRCGRDAGNPAGLTDGPRSHAAASPASRVTARLPWCNRTTRECRACFGPLHPLDRLALLVEIAGILDLRFDRFQLIAHVGRNMFASPCGADGFQMHASSSERLRAIAPD